jgi:prepilin-type N-terminal cleavage/methylation domain-containing protein
VRRGLAAQPRIAPGEAGFTLVELLVASAMAVVLMAGVGTVVLGAMRQQPKIAEKAADVQTARWVTERLTRELRTGVVVDKAGASSVSFQTYVRHSTCGGTGTLPSGSPAIKCEVTCICSGSSCTRTETAPGTYTGTARTIFTGLNNSSSVFSYSPSSTSPTYVGITIAIPATGGGAATTVTDGASLRNATLSN